MSEVSVVLIDSDMGDCTIEQDACERSGLTFHDARLVSAELLNALLRDARGILVQYQVVNEEFLARCPRLRAVGTYSVGTDHIDGAAAAARGISVLPVHDYCVDEVADHTLALALACLRRIVPLALAVRSGNWPGTRDFGSLRTMRDSTYAVVGFGSIGRAVAARAVAFGAEVLVHDPYVDPNVCEALGVARVPLDVAFGCDIVSLHVPLGPFTHHLITGDLLDRMPTHGILINVSRGDVVVEADLLQRVQAGRICAGLDVLSVEPPLPDDVLATSNNALVTPHAGWYSTGAEDRLRAQAGALISRFLVDSLRDLEEAT